MKRLCFLLIMIAFISIRVGSFGTHSDFISSSNFNLSFEYQCTPHDNSVHDDEENNNKYHTKCPKPNKEDECDDKSSKKDAICEDSQKKSLVNNPVTNTQKEVTPVEETVPVESTEQVVNTEKNEEEQPEENTSATP